MLTVLNCGFGVQSSTLLMLSETGELPKLDVAIFADTKSEPRRVYDWINFMQPRISIPIIMGTNGSLKDNLLSKSGERFVSIPTFTDMKGEVGMTRRQCTREFKIAVLDREVRQLLGLKKGQRAPRQQVVEQWIGISWDERQRMSESPHKYTKHRWPLIERQWTRGHCEEYLIKVLGRTAPKSSCTFCPFHDDAMWLDLKENDAEGWAEAVRVDACLREPDSNVTRGMRGKQYLHRSLKPLDQVAFEPNDKQAAFFYGPQNECSGSCFS